MPASLFRELVWLAGCVVFAGVLGVLLGWPFAVISLSLLVYTIWLLNRTNAIIGWLRAGGKAKKAPPTVGQMNEVVTLIHAEKRYSRKQKHRYRAALAQFRGLAADLPDATIVLNEVREIRWANAAAQRLLGISAGRDKGQRIDNLIRDPAFHEFLRDPETVDELEMAGPRDATIILGVRNIPAERGLSVLLARDVTQRVRLRKMRRAFVGNVSHELRTPLTVIRGYLEILLDDAALTAEQRNSLQHIDEQSERMYQIVEHLLELSKLEGNPLGEHEGTPINVSSMVRSLLDALARTHHSRRAIDTLLDDGLFLLGNESDLYSACQNLVVNAIKYAGHNASITVRWELDAVQRPVLSVCDTGPGIEAQHLPRLSERFYRVDKGRSRASGGTGLGLAIVKHVVQRHGGELQIESTPGLGSTFRLVFPEIRALTEPQVMNL